MEREGGLGVADFGMAGPIAGAGQRPALGKAVFVLRVEGPAPIDVAQDRSHPLIVRHQQGAGGGAHEDLDPAAPRQPLQLAEEAGVLVGAADEKGVIAVHAALGPGELVVQRAGVGGGGLGVRHLEHGGDAAEDRAARAAFEIFLPLQARLAEVDLAVDHARKHGEARGVDGLARARLGEVAEVGDLAASDADVRPAAAVLVYHLATAHDQIIGLRHGRPPFRRWRRSTPAPDAARWRPADRSCGRCAGSASDRRP